MSVHRIMGIETEYGISVPGHPTMNAMVTSSQVVNGYASLVTAPGSSIRWDYALESPLRDARGFDQSRADADPSQLTDEDLGLANVILTNGARLYVDHAHPEFSTPEVTNPMDAVLWDRAGMDIMRMGAQHASSLLGYPILLYKNNTDNKGASYGTHENYLMHRQTPFASIVAALTPFFITRQVFTGAGRLGISQDGQIKKFQLSQRADFFEVEVGLETTLKRPIINTRDEPHADPERYRRLHVIVGDANMSEIATWLKMGTTSIVLSMIEAGVDGLLDLMPMDPVREMHQVSHDLTLTHRLDMGRGRRLTALEVQWIFLERAHEHCAQRHGDDPATSRVLEHWESVLIRLEQDPMDTSAELDWTAKLAIMNAYRERDGLDWSDPRLSLIDLQYSDIRPEKGLALRLEARGSLDRLTSVQEVERAITQPPRDTRAYFRGECMRRYPNEVAAAGWDSIVFDVPGEQTLMRVPTAEPARGTAEHVAELLDSSATAGDLIEALRQSG
jgi:proteasome accessory factor A